MKLIKKFISDIYSDLLIYAVFLSYTLRSFDDDAIFKVIGLACSLFFVGLWIQARINLGSAFSVLPEARQLVTKGLYTRFRHPIYLFSSLSYLSLLLILNQRYFYLAGVILALIQIYRARLEGQKLREIFGVRYDEYSKRTLF